MAVAYSMSLYRVGESQREREREARKCHYVNAGARRCGRIDIMHLHIYGGAAQLKQT